MHRLFITLLIATSLQFACRNDTPDATPDADTLGQTGESCDSASDCDSGFCLEELGTGVVVDPITFDGGYCTHACSMDDEGVITGCTAEEICLFYDTDIWDDIPAKENYCYQMGCESDWDCRDETYVCYEFGFPPITESEKACVPVDAVDTGQSRHAEERAILNSSLFVYLQ